MNLSEACHSVAKQFQYKKDGSFGRWSVLKKEPLEGDCEDFSLTVLYRYYGGFKPMLKDLWKRHAKIHTVQASNGKHAVGEVSGQFFDNWTLRPMLKDEFVKETSHKFNKAYHPLYVFWKLTGYWGYLPIVGLTVALVLSVA